MIGAATAGVGGCDMIGAATAGVGGGDMIGAATTGIRGEVAVTPAIRGESSVTAGVEGEDTVGDEFVTVVEAEAEAAETTDGATAAVTGEAGAD